MRQDEYIKTITYNGIRIDVGLNDAGQTYFIEYLENDELKEECVGPYVADYEDYIEWRFGRPEINCPIYHDVTTTTTECCPSANKSLCFKCRKSYTDIAWAESKIRKAEFAKFLKEKK